VQRADIGGDQLLAALELLAQQLLDRRDIHVQQRGQRTKAHDVLEQLALAGIAVRLIGHAGQRHADHDDVLAELRRLHRLGVVIEKVAAGLNAGDILVPGLGVHGDHQIHPAAARAQVPGFRHPHLIPGRQALDVGWEDVPGRRRDAHAQDRLGEQRIGAGRTGPVHIGELDNEVIDPLETFHAVYLLQHTCSACATSIRKRCMSHAPVGHRSAHSPQ
jgi:hypothetical protein